MPSAPSRTACCWLRSCELLGAGTSSPLSRLPLWLLYLLALICVFWLFGIEAQTSTTSPFPLFFCSCFPRGKTSQQQLKHDIKSDNLPVFSSNEKGENGGIDKERGLLKIALLSTLAFSSKNCGDNTIVLVRSHHPTHTHTLSLSLTHTLSHSLDLFLFATTMAKLKTYRSFGIFFLSLLLPSLYDMFENGFTVGGGDNKRIYGFFIVAIFCILTISELVLFAMFYRDSNSSVAENLIDISLDYVNTYMLHYYETKGSTDHLDTVRNVCKRNAMRCKLHMGNYSRFLRRCRNFAIFKVILASGFFLYSIVAYNLDDAPDEVVLNMRVFISYSATVAMLEFLRLYMLVKDTRAPAAISRDHVENHPKYLSIKSFMEAQPDDFKNVDVLRWLTSPPIQALVVVNPLAVQRDTWL